MLLAAATLPLSAAPPGEPWSSSIFGSNLSKWQPLSRTLCAYSSHAPKIITSLVLLFRSLMRSFQRRRDALTIVPRRACRDSFRMHGRNGPIISVGVDRAVVSPQFKVSTLKYIGTTQIIKVNPRRKTKRIQPKCGFFHYHVSFGTRKQTN